MELNEDGYLDVGNADELFKRARRQSDCVTDTAYQRTVELYYVARYLVSLFESRQQSLPLQVWNEYRNAFDHFARHLTASSDMTAEDEHHHLRKMEGHIQRAALDICKFLCIYYDDLYKREISANANVLSLVGDGQFLTAVNESATKARATLLHAKQEDSNLGETADVNRDIVELYCKAVFEYKEIETLYLNNNENISTARLNSKRMATTSTRTQILINVVVATLSIVATWAFLG